jgi:hypothetical protein
VPFLIGGDVMPLKKKRVSARIAALARQILTVAEVRAREATDWV